MYRIETITHKDGTPRTDGKYPERIGSIIHLDYFGTGKVAYLDYLFDNKGNKKDGSLKTSTVMASHFCDDCNMYIVETMNSIYYLKEIVE